MSATVTAPSGERFEGVSGDVLAYYRAEATRVPGYVFTDGTDAGPVEFPIMFSAPSVPAKSAHRADWVTYAQAVDLDLSDEAVAELTIEDMIGRYAPQLVDAEVTVNEKPSPSGKSKTQDESPES